VQITYHTAFPVPIGGGGRAMEKCPSHSRL